MNIEMLMQMVGGADAAIGIVEPYFPVLEEATKEALEAKKEHYKEAIERGDYDSLSYSITLLPNGKLVLIVLAMKFTEKQTICSTPLDYFTLTDFAKDLILMAKEETKK